MEPNNIPYVVLGAGLLWFGWFGFNAGSALTSGGLASSAFIATNTAAAAAVYLDDPELVTTAGLPCWRSHRRRRRPGRHHPGSRFCSAWAAYRSAPSVPLSLTT